MNSSQKTYSVGIIGAGRIAAGFDTSTSKFVLSHAHAFSQHPLFTLVGFVDPDTSLQEVARSWGAPLFSTVEGLCAQQVPDVFVIASPDHTHADMLQTVLAYTPRVIVCEKPLVTTKEDLEKIVQLVNEKNIPVLVNYSRRFDQAISNVKELIQNGSLGGVQHVLGLYSGDFMHNGSHMVDLMRFLFGEMCTTQPLSFEHCPAVTLVNTNKEHYSLFELDLFMEKGRIRIYDNGQMVAMYGTKPSELYEGYVVLGEAQSAKTQLLGAMSVLVDTCAQVLHSGSHDMSGFFDAVKTQETLFELERTYGSK